ncbi:uncharacterized protein LTR77_001107 [Saxophila tyrrhenica]|uniref:xylan 1,4-beta-xylosidase n=1 Tax=Saxophila tyrrhenica TaxID=1690608 RepID=A0AAV9PP28_9PEZI|nr:hypothetical protein LTR77_001107 [Saxophila tyrrhenica]
MHYLSIPAAALLLTSAHQATAQFGFTWHFEYPDCDNGPLADNTVCDTSASPADRAAALVAAMPLNDKFQNLVDRSNGSRSLGLGKYEWWSEALHGVAGSPGVNFSDSGEYSYATSFPMPITFSSAFDDQLVLDIATTISTEARAFSNAGRAGLDFFTPNINPYKDPRWGRGSETPGEDPFRIMEYVKHLILGLEGGHNPKHKKLIATCKHFAGYDMEIWDGVIRYGFDALITSEDLAGYYMPPFQQCARDSKVGSIMCSYNAINGVPACADSYIMDDILRKHWGWDKPDHPYVTSDCNAILDIWTNHEYVSTPEEAAAASYNAGTDQVCEVFNRTAVEGAYDKGLLSEAVIDRALKRQYEALIIAGYFDPASASPYRSIGWDQVNTKEAQTLARKAATEGIVLKKNDGILPMTFEKSMTVAMIGMWANATSQMQGGYSGPPPYFHSPLYAADQLGINYIYATGPINETATHGNWTADAIAAAKKADVVLYFGGIDWSVEAEALDRYQIAWPQSQLSLIDSICGLGKPCIVAQLGDQLDDTPLLNNDNINAILWAGYPSQDGGPAVFDIMTGAVAPAGRLPVTQYPSKYVDEVSLLNMNLQPGDQNPGRTYMWYPDAIIPYGYGMHYTTFTAKFGHGSVENNCHRSIQHLLETCTAEHPDKCELGSLSISVENTGSTTSDFVALAFVRSLTAGPKPYPLKSLASYERLFSIAGGTTSTATLPVNLGELARRDAQGNSWLYPGKYEMLLDVPTQDTIVFTLTGEAAMLEEWPQPPANQTYEAARDCQAYGPCKQLGQPLEL